MKKFLLLLSVFYLGLSPLFSQSNQQSEDFRKLGSPLPDMRIVTAKGDVFTQDDFLKTNPLFVILFNPTCGHCKEMAQMLTEHRSDFADHQVVFVSPAKTASYLPEFEKETGIRKAPEFIVGADAAHFIDIAYNYENVPQVNIYDQDRTLLKVFNGETPLDSLTHYLVR